MQLGVLYHTCTILRLSLTFSLTVMGNFCAIKLARPDLQAHLPVQVPRDITEEQLRPLFEPYGDIEHINILRTHRGQSAGVQSSQENVRYFSYFGTGPMQHLHVIRHSSM